MRKYLLHVLIISFVFAFQVSAYDKTDFEKAKDSKADLSGADLRKADLSGVDLNNANLRDADLSKADLSDATLYRADLSDANLWYANLSGADLSEADLHEAFLRDADLSKADLSDATLYRADLRKADLSDATLCRADLSDADLSDAYLSGVKLMYADLRNAYLIYANLYGADLSDANLSEADLREARLYDADLSHADLSEVLNLNIEQLSEVETLYEAKLDPELKKQVRKKYPHLLGEIEPDEEKLSKPKIINLRSSYKKLSVSQVHSMPNVSIREETGRGFNGHSTINHDYNLKAIKGDVVVVDNATGLMWHQNSSDEYMKWNKAKECVEDLNSRGYAGYHDWRLPTVEEAFSLVESSKRNGLYIDPVFSRKQVWIWTGNRKAGSESAWGVHFDFGGVYGGDVVYDGGYVRPVRSVR
jgi:uncharacterized protein YjbI with pentapeptide repeats